MIVPKTFPCRLLITSALGAMSNRAGHQIEHGNHDAPLADRDDGPSPANIDVTVRLLNGVKLELGLPSSYDMKAVKHAIHALGLIPFYNPYKQELLLESQILLNSAVLSALPQPVNLLDLLVSSGYWERAPGLFGARLQSGSKAVVDQLSRIHPAMYQEQFRKYCKQKNQRTNY